MPRQTLQRYLQKEDFTVPKLGRKTELGIEAEEELERYLILRQECGFVLTRAKLRNLAFDFLEKLGVNHRFNKTKKIAGWDWMYSFLRRHPKIVIRKEENLSINRALGMNKKNVQTFFGILESKLSELNMLNKPDRIFNADESGLQMNTRGRHVFCEKGKKNIHSIFPKEKGETVTVLACCNAAGNFMPPTVIFKGKRIHTEYQGQLPPGSYVFVSDSGYVITDIFFCFVKHFISYFKVNPADPAVLVDGHESHCDNFEMLQHCVDSGLTMVCLPPHTTHWLQPTDRSFFKPLKKNYYEEAACFVRTNGRSFTKIEFCSVFSKAWLKSATTGNSINGFRATGIWPLNMGEIPDHAYIGDTLSDPNPRPAETSSSPVSDSVIQHGHEPSPFSIPGTSSYVRSHKATLLEKGKRSNTKPVSGISLPSTSKSAQSSAPVLQELSPIPKLMCVSGSRGRSKRVARELTSKESLSEAKKRAENRVNRRYGVAKRKTDKTRNGNDSCICPICKGNYYDENQGQEWVQCCGKCKLWYHEKCVQLEGNLFYCDDYKL